MNNAQKTGYISIDQMETRILIDASVTTIDLEPQKTGRICWNTGEEKNCPGCYLGRTCKAK
jgi:hypothetical protein